jgi:hypothetical protein
MSARESYRVEIPLVVAIRHERAELLALLSVDREEHVDEAAPERLV